MTDLLLCHKSAGFDDARPFRSMARTSRYVPAALPNGPSAAGASGLLELLQDPP